ncbi:hypothetical protein [Rhizobium tumorigenes]|uniref:Uncharacterized protein n=1 Tax=Rhizobium tumorigenes TaxID=2041385 RepID=A0AAF1KLB6_9HYPH|nr:hypothetical protein [Rhizobium tumorigenes]WFR97623.1 hypothetical protein PR017_20735 [Rhizobium tumorigenes]
MMELTFWFRSFHPQENGGAGGLLFHGDNRDFPSDLHATQQTHG